MNLEVSISPRASAWLAQKAHAAGTDPAAVAASALEQLAERELGSSGAARAERLHRFREWVSGLSNRPGPLVDASRASIYD